VEVNDVFQETLGEPAPDVRVVQQAYDIEHANGAPCESHLVQTPQQLHELAGLLVTMRQNSGQRLRRRAVEVQGWEDGLKTLVGEIELERHALDAAELGGGNGVDLIGNDGQSAGCEEHCEVLESVVHEARVGANLSVELKKAWLVRSGELGDVALGRGRQDELVDPVAKFRRQLKEVRLRRIELGRLRVGDLVLGCHRFGWVTGDGGAGVCCRLLVSLIRGRRRWLLVVVKTFRENLFSCVD
jgi:hypothetical protein